MMDCVLPTLRCRSNLGYGLMTCQPNWRRLSGSGGRLTFRALLTSGRNCISVSGKGSR